MLSRTSPQTSNGPLEGVLGSGVVATPEGASSATLCGKKVNPFSALQSRVVQLDSDTRSVCAVTEDQRLVCSGESPERTGCVGSAQLVEELRKLRVAASPWAESDAACKRSTMRCCAGGEAGARAWFTESRDPRSLDRYLRGNRRIFGPRITDITQAKLAILDKQYKDKQAADVSARAARAADSCGLDLSAPIRRKPHCNCSGSLK
jgi:hypothetical protein